MFVDKTIFQEYYENFASRYIYGLKKSQENGEIANIDLETLAYILMGISNFVGLQVIFKKQQNIGNIDEELDRIVDQIIYVLKNGIFTNKK